MIVISVFFIKYNVKITGSDSRFDNFGYIYTVSGRGSFVAPESEWRDDKKRKVLSEWQELTKRTRLAGLSKEELIRELERIYKEERE